MIEKPLTEAQLKRASKLAEKGRRALSGIEINQLRRANSADSEFKPLIQTLTENQKRRLRKEVKGGK